MNAQLHQYRTKQRKIQQLSCATIYHDDYLPEVAGAAIEHGAVTVNLEMKGDAEDEDPSIDVVYDAARDLYTD